MKNIYTKKALKKKSSSLIAAAIICAIGANSSAFAVGMLQCSNQTISEEEAFDIYTADQLQNALNTLEDGTAPAEDLAAAAGKIGGAIEHVKEGHVPVGTNRQRPMDLLEGALSDHGVLHGGDDASGAVQMALNNSKIHDAPSFKNVMSIVGDQEGATSVAATGFKYAGHAVMVLGVVVGVGQSIHHVVTAPDHLEAAAEEAGGWAASIQGAEVAAAACAELGPVALACGMAGGALGYAVGSGVAGEAEKIAAHVGGAVWHSVKSEAACNRWNPANLICDADRVTPPIKRIFSWLGL